MTDDAPTFADYTCRKCGHQIRVNPIPDDDQGRSTITRPCWGCLRGKPTGPAPMRAFTIIPIELETTAVELP